MIFLLLSRKMIFSRKYDLVLWTENGRSSLSKDTTEDYIFCKCSEKMNFQKTALECDLSCIIRKDDIFFENMILFLRQERKDDLSQKNIWKYDIFFKCSENLVFSKNCIEIWSFSYYLEKLYFFFPKTWSYSLEAKWKMNFLKKMNVNIIFSANVLKRWSFQKTVLEYGLFCIIRKDDIFPKIWSYSIDGRWKVIFIKRYIEIWYFLYI